MEMIRGAGFPPSFLFFLGHPCYFTFMIMAISATSCLRQKGQPVTT